MAKEVAASAADQDLAMRAFAHVAADPGLLSALLDATGAAPSDLAQAAQRPEFAGFILDFLMQADDRVSAFAAAEGITPEAVARAHARLVGPLD